MTMAPGMTTNDWANIAYSGYSDQLNDMLRDGGLSAEDEARIRSDLGPHYADAVVDQVIEKAKARASQLVGAQSPIRAIRNDAAQPAPQPPGEPSHEPHRPSDAVVFRTAQSMVNEHTSWGNLREGDLGVAVAELLRNDSTLGRATVARMFQLTNNPHLAWKDRGQVAEGLCADLTRTELNTLVGRDQLVQLHDALTGVTMRFVKDGQVSVVTERRPSEAQQFQIARVEDALRAR